MMVSKEIEIRAYKTFVYPNLSLIDTKCKELGLKEETIKKAKDLAIEYIEKTYHNPPYSHIKFLLPAFVQIASIRNDDKRTQREIAETFGVTGVSMRKWYVHITSVMGIEIVQ